MFFPRSRSIFIASCVAVATAVLGVAACSGQGSVTPANPGTARQNRAVRPVSPASSIQLVPGTTVGQAVFPEGDTKTGGQGQYVDGIPCHKILNAVIHHHIHLSLFVNGVQYAIPRGTGMKNPRPGNFVYHADCFYFLHTHDATGIVHIEAGKALTFTLKEYFNLWGEPLSTTGVAGYNGAVTVFVNGVQQNVDPNTLTFNPFDPITLEVGTPVVTPPVYIFPPGYP